jgi:hypothetical protein
VPDSQEYAIVARRLATQGSYDIELRRTRYPPARRRGCPCSSTPIFWIAPGELGNAVLPVFALSIAGVLIAFALGQRLAGPWEARSPQCSSWGSATSSRWRGR